MKEFNEEDGKWWEATAIHDRIIVFSFFLRFLNIKYREGAMKKKQNRKIW